MAGSDDEEARVAKLVLRVATLDDHDAFAEIVRTYQAPVRRFLARLTARPDAADDLAQDTFVKAYRHISSYRGDGRFASWLMRIAYQEFVSGVRRRAPIEQAIEEGPADGSAADRLVAALSIARAMSALRPEERAAIDLHYRHELTHAEVAGVLGLPLGTVKSLILRGRAKLKDVLTGVRGTEVET